MGRARLKKDALTGEHPFLIFLSNKTCVKTIPALRGQVL
jgi:hypothetical protein